MFSLKVEATTVEGLKEKLTHFLQNGFPNAAAPMSAGPDKGSPSVERGDNKSLTSTSAAAALTQLEPKKPGRPKKADAPGAGPTAPSPAAPAPAAAAASVPGSGDPLVRAACLKVNEKLGISVVSEILKKHAGVSRIQEVPADKAAAVIAACEKAVA